MNDFKALRYKLLVTIINNKKGRDIVRAVKKVGVEGDTVLIGRGTPTKKEKKLWDLDMEPTREIVFNLLTEDLVEASLNEILEKTPLNKPGKGIAFVIDVAFVAGICHACDLRDKDKFIEFEEGNMTDQTKHVLLIIIVGKGNASIVIDAACSAGAAGGTIMTGRGSGVHEKAKLFGIDIEPEKEVVLIVVEKENHKEILRVINEKSKLNEPGQGIAFVLPLDHVVGLRQ